MSACQRGASDVSAEVHRHARSLVVGVRVCLERSLLFQGQGRERGRVSRDQVPHAPWPLPSLWG